MDEKRILLDECECYYFDFSSTTFFHEFKGLIVKTIKDVLDQQKTDILKLTDSENHSHINKEFEAIYRKYIKVVHKLLPELEGRVKNFFAIPECVIPVFDLSTRFQIPADNNVEISSLNKEIEELKKTYIKEKAFQQFCEVQLQALKNLEPLYKEVEEILNKKNCENKIKENKIEEQLTKYDKHIKPFFQDGPEKYELYMAHYSKYK